MNKQQPEAEVMFELLNLLLTPEQRQDGLQLTEPMINIVRFEFHGEPLFYCTAGATIRQIEAKSLELQNKIKE